MVEHKAKKRAAKKGWSAKEQSKGQTQLCKYQHISNK